MDNPSSELPATTRTGVKTGLTVYLDELVVRASKLVMYYWSIFKAEYKKLCSPLLEMYMPICTYDLMSRK